METLTVAIILKRLKKAFGEEFTFKFYKGTVIGESGNILFDKPGAGHFKAINKSGNIILLKSYSYTNNLYEFSSITVITTACKRAIDAARELYADINFRSKNPSATPKYFYKDSYKEYYPTW